MGPLWTFAPSQNPRTAENIRSAASRWPGDRAILLDSLRFTMHGVWHVCCAYPDEAVKRAAIRLQNNGEAGQDPGRNEEDGRCQPQFVVPEYVSWDCFSH